MPRFTTAFTTSLAVKSDWPILLESLSQNGTTVLKLSQKDPALYNRPTKVHVVMFHDVIPNGMTAEQAVTTPIHGSTVVPEYDGTEILVSVAVPLDGAGLYQVMVIGEYAN